MNLTHQHGLRLVLPRRLTRTVASVIHQTSAPGAMVFAMALSTISSVVMRNHQVSLLPGRVIPLGLSVLNVAAVNERKTTVEKCFTKVLLEFEKSQKCEHTRKHNLWKIANDVGKSKIKGCLRAIETATAKGIETTELEAQMASLILQQQPEPKRIRLILSSGTYEGFCRFLAEQNGFAFWSVGDGGTFFDSRGASNAAGFANMWSGVPPDHITKTDGQSDLESVSIAVDIAVQPEIFSEFLKSKKGRLWLGTGLLSRFMVLFPQSTQGTRPTDFEFSQALDLSEYEDRMRELLAHSLTAQNDPPVVLKFSTEALAELTAVAQWIECELLPGGWFTDMPGTAGKMVENIARIAAVFHVFEGEAGLISYDTATRAIEVGKMFLGEFKRLFGEVPVFNQIAVGASAVLRHILEWESKAGINQLVALSLIGNRGTTVLRDRAIRDASIQMCIQNGWVNTWKTQGSKTMYASLTDVGRPLAYDAVWQHHAGQKRL